MGEGITKRNMIRRCPTGVRQHGNQGEDDEHGAAHCDGEVELANFFWVGGGIFHTGDYTREEVTCQGLEMWQWAIDSPQKLHTLACS